MTLDLSPLYAATEQAKLADPARGAAAAPCPISASRRL
jgi:hypothetical protein